VTRHALTDQQWAIIRVRLPQRRGPNNEKANRNFIDAIVWMAKTGAPWRDLDSCFGPWKTIYNRFRNWCLRGWWLEIFRDEPIQEEVASIIDGSVVRAHQDASGGRGGPQSNALGRSRGGVSTKMHAVVTLAGKPIEIRITAGQQHEITMAETLIDFVHGDACLADGGYDADRILDELRARGIKPVIPPSKNRKTKRRYDKILYSFRYRVEVFFHQIKRYRRIATRYDKTPSSYLGFIHAICMLIAL